MTMPTFLIVGAQKAGTSSIHHYLAQHPDVFMSRIKEPNYFLDEEEVAVARVTLVRSRAEYESLFRHANGKRAIGEASVAYLQSVNAPDRIRAELPGARIVICLRNPADRAWSGYWMKVRDGLEARDAEGVLRPGSRPYERGFYAAGIRRFLGRFPRERVHFVVYDDFVARPAEVMRDLFEFLGVDPTFAVDLGKRLNEGAAPRFPSLNRWLSTLIHDRLAPLFPRSLVGRGYGLQFRKLFLRPVAKIPAGLRSRLLEAYRKDIHETGVLIGRDLSVWLDND